MDNKVGYIYIRDHWSYEIDNVYKLGKTIGIPDRDQTYVTGEYHRGKILEVYEVAYIILDDVEEILQDIFIELHKQQDGGEEFYRREIIRLIEPAFDDYEIEYRKLTDNEISELKRIKRDREVKYKRTKKEIMHSIHSKSGKQVKISDYDEDGKRKRGKCKPRDNQQIEIIDKLPTPRDDQVKIIDKAVEHFCKHDKGMLVLICGVGKTLISLWITLQLIILQLIPRTILIGVPNKLLLDQWAGVIHLIFGKIPLFKVSDNVNIDSIKDFLNKNKDAVVITTYASAHKVYNAVQDNGFVFGMKINDEVHHLTSTNFNDTDRKTFVNMLRIESQKQISLTATMKILEGERVKDDNNEIVRDEAVSRVLVRRDEDIIISNDNIEIFGQVIERRSMLWAINKGIICDYVIQTVVADAEQLKQHFSKFGIHNDIDKRLFLAAFAALKSINNGHSHHPLVYTNSKASSTKVNQYIKLLIDDKYFEIPDLYYSGYYGDMGMRTQRNIISKFTSSRHGIITCVYCLGEGWDLPLLDSVVYAENMTSTIRIVQTAMRGSRKDIARPNKILKIISTILINKDEDYFTSGRPDQDKTIEIINQLGIEDQAIEQKIKVCKITVEKQNYIEREGIAIDELGEYDEALTHNLRLKTMARFAMITYDKARRIVAPYVIKSKAEYYDLCNRDNRLPREPDVTFGTSFINWIDYLSIDQRFYDLAQCKDKIAYYMGLYPDMRNITLKLSKIVDMLCELDPLFPSSDLWLEYYNVKNLQEIITLTPKKKKVKSNLL